MQYKVKFNLTLFPSTSKNNQKHQVGAKLAPAFILLCKILNFSLENIFFSKNKSCSELWKNTSQLIPTMETSPKNIIQVFRFGLLAKSLQPCMTVSDDDADT